MRDLNKKTALLVVLPLVFGIVAGGLFVYMYLGNKTETMQKKYNLLAKRVLIDNPNDVIINFEPLSNKLNNYVDTNLKDVKNSIYFEYLPTGSSVGVNEDQQLVGASLLKTPLAITLYKASEQGRVKLDNPVTLQKDWLNNQFGELYKKGAGYKISLRNLTKLMLTNSDNTAELAVFNTLDRTLNQKISLLGFVDADHSVNKDETLQLGAQSYSSILKCLYFACYLNKDNSQELLNYLSQSEYDKRLKLYINDPSLKVAHKYGTFGDLVQSDCGIFYMPNKNYLLCVMINQGDPQASRHIGDISQIVYDYMKQASSNTK